MCGACSRAESLHAVVLKKAGLVGRLFTLCELNRRGFSRHLVTSSRKPERRELEISGFKVGKSELIRSQITQ